VTDQDEVQRWSRQLRLWLAAQERSQRSVERELGWGAGYLSQLFRPTPPDLKIKHVVGILRVLKVPLRMFFAGLYGPEKDPDDLRSMTREEVKDFIALSLRQELVRMGEDAVALRGRGRKGRREKPEEPEPASEANGEKGEGGEPGGGEPDEPPEG
jgi:hypothetical protein